MKKIIFTLFLFSIAQIAMSQILYSQKYVAGIPGNLFKYFKANDRYYIYGGDMAPAQGFLSKIDSSGNMLWANHYLYPDGVGMVFKSVIKDYTDSLVFAVSGDYPSEGSVIKTDIDGNIAWNLKFEYPINDIIQTNDSNYAVIGQKNVAASPSDWDLYFTKISRRGTILISKHYPVTTTPGMRFNILDKIANTIIQAENNNYYVFLNTYDSLYLYRLSPFGQPVWLKEYRGDTVSRNPYLVKEENWKMIKGVDSSMIICGTDIPQANYLSAMKVDLSGNIIWSKKYTYSKPINLVNVFTEPDSTITLFAGVSSGLQINDNAVLRLNQSGSLIQSFKLKYQQEVLRPYWLGINDDFTHNFLSMVDLDSINSLSPMLNSRLNSSFQSDCVSDSTVLFMETSVADSVQHSLAVYTLAATSPVLDTVAPTSLQVSSEIFCLDNLIESDFSNEMTGSFPNPFSNELTIRIHSVSPNKIMIRINTIFGQTIYEQQKENVDETITEKIETSNFSAGVYLLEIKINENKFIKKMIKL